MPRKSRARPWPTSTSWRSRRPAPARLAPPPPAGDALVLVAARDNDRRRDEIERHYRDAIRNARREVIIANAYFFPGYRLLKELRNAARRGVNVRLILQGRPDMPFVRWIGLTLYDYLLRAGVHIHEYCERPLHGKVATVDEHWATVGSCNLDPLSLSLNLEANVIVRERAFNQELRDKLAVLMERHCKVVTPEQAPRRTLGRQILSFLAFHVARRFPAWAGWVPGHGRPQLPVTVEPGAEPSSLQAPPPKKEAA
jgi:cardiolipin synthase A/B